MFKMQCQLTCAECDFTEDILVEMKVGSDIPILTVGRLPGTWYQDCHNNRNRLLCTSECNTENCRICGMMSFSHPSKKSKKFNHEFLPGGQGRLK